MINGKRQIVVMIETSGVTNVEAINYSGGVCAVATEPIRNKVIGGSPDYSKMKPEFYDRARQPGIKLAE